MYITSLVLYCSFVQADEDEGLTAVADYIQENNVPISFLMMLFAHFMSMVIDRCVYMYAYVLIVGFYFFL